MAGAGGEFGGSEARRVGGAAGRPPVPFGGSEALRGWGGYGGAGTGAGGGCEGYEESGDEWVSEGTDTEGQVRGPCLSPCGGGMQRVRSAARVLQV